MKFKFLLGASALLLSTPALATNTSSSSAEKTAHEEATEIQKDDKALNHKIEEDKKKIHKVEENPKSSTK